jgi:hypothetical protein
VIATLPPGSANCFFCLQCQTEPGGVLTHADVVDTLAADREANDVTFGLVLAFDEYRGQPEIHVDGEVRRIAEFRPEEEIGLVQVCFVVKIKSNES